jgi:hypothetical protein
LTFFTSCCILLNYCRNPGAATDDETLYGSGRSTDPVHSGNTGTLSGEGSHLASAKEVGQGHTAAPTSGEGSHFGDARDTTTRSSNLDNTSTTAGPHSSNLANKADPRVDSDLDGSRTAGNTSGEYNSTGGSSMPGGFPADTETRNPYSVHEADSRLGGTSQNTSSGLGSSITPEQTSTTGQSGVTNPNIPSSTDHHYARDGAAIGGVAAVGEGVHQHRETEYAPQTSSTTSHPGGTTTTNTTTTSSTTTGPHKSDLLNKVDPRVDSDNSKQATETSGHHYSRDGAALGGAAVVGEGIHHHRENERDNQYSNTGTSGSGNTYEGTGNTYGAPGNTTSSTTSGPHNSDLLNKADPRVDSDNSKSGYSGTTPSGTGTGTYYGGPSGTAVSGPHHTATANRLDPSINRDSLPIDDASQHHPETGGGGVSADRAHGDSSTDHHYGRDAAGVGAAGVGAHELSKHHKEKELDREQGYSQTTDTATSQGLGSSTDPNLTGPVHKSALLNKLDPRVKETSATAVGTSNTQPGYDSANTSKDQHYGRDAAGVGAAGVGAHELDKHHREKELERGQAYDSTPGKLSSTSNTGGHGERDALAAASVTGAAGYEAEKHHADQQSRNTTQSGVASTQQGYGSSQPGYDSSSTSKDHHLGRDAAVVGGAGIGAHELHKHHNENAAGNAASGGLGDEPGLSEHEKLKREAARNQRGNDYAQGTAGSGYDNTVGGAAGTSTTDSEKDHHYGRDVAGAGVVGGAAYEAEKHHSHDKDQKALEKEHKQEVKEAEKEHKHEVKEAEKEHKRELKEEKKEEKKEKKHGHGGLFGFLRTYPDITGRRL